MVRRPEPEPPAEPDGSSRSTRPPDGLLEVGRVGRAHGIRGEVAVTLVTDRVERVEPGTTLWVGERCLEIEASRPHQGRFLVRFAGVADRSAAEALHGLVLSAEPLDDPAVLWVHQLVGSEVVAAADGARLGVVTAVEANPASDLLVLEGGGLVPLTFLVRSEPGRLVVDPPAGLLE
jgi:16S rRNA processing protein RimM